MALCKLVHCLEFNGKFALSPSHLIHTRIHFFPIRINFIMSSYIIPGLMIAWPPKPQLISSLIHLFNPELPDHHPPTPPFLSSPIYLPLSRPIPSSTTITWCLLSAPHNSVHLEKHQSEVSKERQHALKIKLRTGRLVSMLE